MGGGPRFTNINANIEGAKEFFNEPPSCDVFVVNQGEKGFYKVAKTFYDKNFSTKDFKEASIPGSLVNNSDFNKNLSNLDVALMVASKSSRLQLLALESPETALKQRQQFLYGLIRDNNPLRASQRSVSYQVESRLYNYYVHQALIDNTYSFHKCSIPNYQDYSKDAFNEIISDKEIDLQKEIKKIFDPNNILNPRKIFN